MIPKAALGCSGAGELRDAWSCIWISIIRTKCLEVTQNVVAEHPRTAVLRTNRQPAPQKNPGEPADTRPPLTAQSLPPRSFLGSFFLELSICTDGL